MSKRVAVRLGRFGSARWLVFERVGSVLRSGMNGPTEITRATRLGPAASGTGGTCMFSAEAALQAGLQLREQMRQIAMSLLGLACDQQMAKSDDVSWALSRPPGLFTATATFSTGNGGTL